MTSVHIQAKPGRSKNFIIWNHGKLEVHVTARANQGAANEAIVSLLAQALQVPKSSVEIVSGHTSSYKKIVLHRCSADEWQHFLQSLPTQTPAP